MVGINSNIAALGAQANLNRAANQSQLSINKLSSGNAIIQASEDVAALSVGTSLRTNVSTLRTALSSAGQAVSLLQIADSGLANVGEILQRQKALAVQANSGTLSNTERAFLNQEFQALASEIDRIVDSTEFNGIKLLDGSIGGTNNLGTAAGDTTETYSLNLLTDYSSVDSLASGGFTAAAAISTVATREVVTFTLDIGSLTAADNLTLGGASATTFTFSTQADANTEIQIGADAAATAANIVGALNGTAATAEAELADYRFQLTSVAGNVITITATAKLAGAAGDIVTNAAFEDTITSTLTVTGVAEATLAEASTLFNASLQGAATIDSATYSQENGESFISFIATVNGQTYQSDVYRLTDGSTTAAGTTFDSNIVNFANGGASGTGELRFYRVGADSTEAGFNLDIGTLFDTTITSQALADTLVATINDELTGADAEIYQTRAVASVDPTKVDGTVLDGIADSDVTITDNAFAADGTLGDIEAFNVDVLRSKITVTVNGTLYTATLGNTAADGEVDFASSAIGINAGDTFLTFTTASTTDGKQLRIDLSGLSSVVGGNGSIDLSTDAKATEFQNALNSLFGVGTEDALNFQIGASTTDIITVAVDSVSTSEIYKDADGVTQTLSVSDAESAEAASIILDLAINDITTRRANVGALQSRFNFASANLEASIQNIETARASFLDVDVAEESTTFSTAQVRLQASISVLAQANAITQNLLKLIG